MGGGEGRLLVCMMESLHLSGELFLNELSREKEAGGILGEEGDKQETVEYNNPTNHRAVFLEYITTSSLTMEVFTEVALF